MTFKKCSLISPQAKRSLFKKKIANKTSVMKKFVTIPARYDPIIFSGVLRETLSEWSVEKLNSQKNHNKQGCLFDNHIEHRILDLQNQFLNSSEAEKCALFPFQFKLKRKNVEIFGDGPEIFLKLNGKPSIFFRRYHIFSKRCSQMSFIRKHCEKRWFS